MDIVIALHSHLPYVLNNGRWPHGSDWLCEAAMDCYLPLLEALEAAENRGNATPITLGITPVLAAQLADPGFPTVFREFLTQRLDTCDEATTTFQRGSQTNLLPPAEFWKGRIARLWRLFDRIDRDIIGAVRRHAASGRVELISSAATHGFLPLLGRDESIRFQLAVGLTEHRRLFGADPRGCWLPECAYRPAGPWQPHPEAPASSYRIGIETHLSDAGYRYFFTDPHLAGAATIDLSSLDLTVEDERVARFEVPQSPLGPYRAYRVAGTPTGRPVTALLRDPIASQRVWSRYEGYPGDGSYLEFHKIRSPGGLKLWKVTGGDVDLGDKAIYDPNIARAQARRHAAHYAGVLETIRANRQAPGEDLIAAPFDTELFGHWWFEGIDFLSDLFLELTHRPAMKSVSASEHLAIHPPLTTARLTEGSWGANGDFSSWLGPTTDWTWRDLWPVEERFWRVIAGAYRVPALRPAVEQAGRELLIAQASDWQFLITAGTAGDYATTRFIDHLRHVGLLLDGIEGGVMSPALESLVEARFAKNGIFPEIWSAFEPALALGTPLRP